MWAFLPTNQFIFRFLKALFHNSAHTNCFWVSSPALPSLIPSPSFLTRQALSPAHSLCIASKLMHIVICNQGCKLYLKLYCTIHGYLNHKWEYCPACTLTYSFSRNRSFHLCSISFSTPAFRPWKFPLFSSGLECWWCGHVCLYPIICLALLYHRFPWIWFVCFDKSKHHDYIVP